MLDKRGKMAFVYLTVETLFIDRPPRPVIKIVDRPRSLFENHSKGQQAFHSFK